MKSIIIHLTIINIILYMSTITVLSNENSVFEGNLSTSDFDDVFGDIHIRNPSDSEILIIGSVYTIGWEYKGGISYVSIGLYKDLEFIEYIMLVTVNNGSHIWKVGNYPLANDYSIGIWDYNDFNSGDFSDFFIITKKAPPLDYMLEIVEIICFIAFISLVLIVSIAAIKKRSLNIE